MLATNCPMPGRMDAAQASPVSAWIAVSREQNGHPLVPPTERDLRFLSGSRPRLASASALLRRGVGSEPRPAVCRDPVLAQAGRRGPLGHTVFGQAPSRRSFGAVTGLRGAILRARRTGRSDVAQPVANARS